jgi:hypothetical protein
MRLESDTKRITAQYNGVTPMNKDESITLIPWMWKT